MRIPEGAFHFQTILPIVDDWLVCLVVRHRGPTALAATLATRRNLMRHGTWALWAVQDLSYMLVLPGSKTADSLGSFESDNQKGLREELHVVMLGVKRF